MKKFNESKFSNSYDIENKIKEFNKDQTDIPDFQTPQNFTSTHYKSK